MFCSNYYSHTGLLICKSESDLQSKVSSVTPDREKLRHKLVEGHVWTAKERSPGGLVLHQHFIPSIILGFVSVLVELTNISSSSARQAVLTATQNPDKSHYPEKERKTPIVFSSTHYSWTGLIFFRCSLTNTETEGFKYCQDAYMPCPCQHCALHSKARPKHQRPVTESCLLFPLKPTSASYVLQAKNSPASCKNTAETLTLPLSKKEIISW